MFTVQCDFDGTVTVRDVGVAIMRTFASPQREEVEASYLAGEISVEESNKRQYALARVGPEELEQFISKTPVVRDGFTEFVGFCRAAGIPLVIVSCGMDLYIEPILKRLGMADIEHYSASARFKDGTVDVQYIDPWGVNRVEGFKSAYLRYLRQRGHPIIYIGDSISDIAPAMEADYVLATGTLVEYLRTRGKPHFPFDTFHDVTRYIKKLLEKSYGAL